MKKEFDYPEYIDSLAYVKCSKNRMSVVKSIGNTLKIPSEIAKEMFNLLLSTSSSSQRTLHLSTNLPCTD